MLSTLRSRRAAFWYLAPDRIVAAVVSRSDREPVLEACAASYSPPLAGACFAPGVVEVSWVLGCERLPHVAALAGSFCRIEECADERPRRRSPLMRAIRGGRRGAGASAGVTGAAAPEAMGVGAAAPDTTAAGLAASVPARVERRGTVRDADRRLRVFAEEQAVEQAAALFRRARLSLVALDCEPCALASLSDALGTADADGARRQHLSAVAVAPETENVAEALGEDLAVPLGLAVAWFGVGRAV